MLLDTWKGDGYCQVTTFMKSNTYGINQDRLFKFL